MIYSKTLNHIHKKGKTCQGHLPVLHKWREAFLEQSMLSAVCVFHSEGQPLTLLTQSQSSHSSVFVEVAVTSPAWFPLCWIPSTVPFHRLASSPRNPARWRGNSWERIICNKAPRILRRVQESPLLNKFKEPEGIFIQDKGSVRRRKQNASWVAQSCCRAKDICNKATSFVYFLAFGNMTTDLFTKA